LLNQLQRANLVRIFEWKQNYKAAQRWEVTEAGRLFAGLPVPPLAGEEPLEPEKKESSLTSLLPPT
jgi:hypothetical protein